MPNNAVSLALYVFALFPGVAFAFMSEGHRPIAKRSALRETAAVISVSVLCDSVVLLLLIAVSLFVPPLAKTLEFAFQKGDAFVASNVQWLFPSLLGLLTVATLLGAVLGSKRAYEAGLKKLWTSSLVNRDASAWGIAVALADDDDKIQLGIQLKSGTWVQGQLHHFDNAGDGDPTRALVLTGELKHRPIGVADQVDVSGYGLIVVEAGEIDFLMVGYEPQSLSVAHAAELRDALRSYVAAARPAAKKGVQPSAARSPQTSTAHQDELRRMREWARANGYEVSDRGRVAAEIQAAYRATL